MAPAKGDLTASMVILGLLIRQPDTTSRVRARLAREFPHGRWSRSVGYGDMRSLANQGLIRKVQAGERCSEDLYEATSEGRVAFKAWLSDAAKAPPSVRDAMLLWLEHSDPSEAPEILQVVREVEDAARLDFEAAQIRLNSERALGNLGPADGADWHGRMREAVLSELVRQCGENTLRMKRLRQKILNDRRGLHPQAPVDGDG